MKGTVAVASWALLLLSDLGQSHLLLGKSHVQKKKKMKRTAARVSEVVVGVGWGGGCIGRGREGLRRRWMGVEGDRKQRLEVVFYGALGKKTERQKRRREAENCSRTKKRNNKLSEQKGK